VRQPKGRQALHETTFATTEQRFQAMYRTVEENKYAPAAGKFSCRRPTGAVAVPGVSVCLRVSCVGAQEARPYAHPPCHTRTHPAHTHTPTHGCTHNTAGEKLSTDYKCQRENHRDMAKSTFGEDVRETRVFDLHRIEVSPAPGEHNPHYGNYENKYETKTEWFRRMKKEGVLKGPYTPEFVSTVPKERLFIDTLQDHDRGETDQFSMMKFYPLTAFDEVVARAKNVPEHAKHRTDRMGRGQREPEWLLEKAPKDLPEAYLGIDTHISTFLPKSYNSTIQQQIAKRRAAINLRSYLPKDAEKHGSSPPLTSQLETDNASLWAAAAKASAERTRALKLGRELDHGQGRSRSASVSGRRRGGGGGGEDNAKDEDAGRGDVIAHFKRATDALAKRRPQLPPQTMNTKLEFSRPASPPPPGYKRPSSAPARSGAKKKTTTTAAVPPLPAPTASVDGRHRFSRFPPTRGFSNNHRRRAAGKPEEKQQRRGADSAGSQQHDSEVWTNPAVSPITTTSALQQKQQQLRACQWSRAHTPAGKPYWFHVETQETRWDRPAGYFMDDDDETTVADDDKTVGSASDVGWPLGREPRVLPSLDRSRTPRGMDKQGDQDHTKSREERDGSHGEEPAVVVDPARSVVATDGGSVCEPVHKPRWSRARAHDQRPYWFDVETNATTWQRPDGYRTEDDDESTVADDNDGGDDGETHDEGQRGTTAARTAIAPADAAATLENSAPVAHAGVDVGDGGTAPPSKQQSSADVDCINRTQASAEQEPHVVDPTVTVTSDEVWSLPAPVAQQAAEAGGTVAPSAITWSRAFSPDGKPYWFDVNTNETTWVRPDGYRSEDDNEEEEAVEDADATPSATEESAGSASPVSADAAPGASKACAAEQAEPAAARDESSLTALAADQVPPRASGEEGRAQQGVPEGRDGEQNVEVTSSIGTSVGTEEARDDGAEVVATAADEVGAQQAHLAVGTQATDELAPTSSEWSHGGEGSAALEGVAVVVAASEEADRNMLAPPARDSQQVAHTAHGDASASSRRNWSRAAAADGQPCWFNVDTNETTWDRPDDYRSEDEDDNNINNDDEEEEEDHGVALVLAADDTAAVGTDAAAALSAQLEANTMAQWSRLWADEPGAYYWYNAATSETTWDRPYGYAVDDNAGTANDEPATATELQAHYGDGATGQSPVGHASYDAAAAAAAGTDAPAELL
jgi:hypothetical protein